MEKDIRKLLDNLRSPEPSALAKAVGEAEKALKKFAGENKQHLLEALLQLFYLDLYDRPELAPVQEAAMEAVAGLARDPKVADFLIEHLKYPDLKASITIARVLGRTGKSAVGKLMGFYGTQADPYPRAMALHALSKVKDPEVLAAGDLILEALKDAHSEIRDTAARTVGKFCEYFPPDRFERAWIDRAFAALVASLSDPMAPVRAKAVRSMGKMARGGFLTPAQNKQLEQICLKALGQTDFAWDVAYIVRLEADEALKHVKG
jgi:HEAT repeat protein